MRYLAYGIICLLVAGCFGKQVQPGHTLMTENQYTPGCLLAFPVCAWQQGNTIGQAIGNAALGTLVWPIAWLVILGKERTDECHNRGGHIVCVDNDCRCVTVD